MPRGQNPYTSPDDQPLFVLKRDLGGGQNDRQHPQMIADNQAVVLQNILLDTAAQTSLRQGQTQVDTSYPTDQYLDDNGIDSFTELLLSLNNNVTDISSNGFTVTNNGVTFDNTLPAFAGTYYGVFNGTSAYLSIPNSADFNFTSDFTVDGWFNFASNSETYDLFGNGYEVGIFLAYTGNKLYLTLGTTPFLLEPAFTPTINTWYHLAVVRASGTVTIYVNGNSIGSGSYATALSSTYAMYIGYDPIGSIYFAGKISEFRMSNVARWTSNFTPPTQPAGNSGNPVTDDANYPVAWS